MDVRHVAAVAAVPCLCLLATPADAQSRRNATYRPIAFELAPAARPDAADHRLQEVDQPAQRASGMLGTLAVTDDAEIGIGRFGVGTIARARTNIERDRMMERENRSIAGAGMRLRF